MSELNKIRLEITKTVIEYSIYYDRMIHYEDMWEYYADRNVDNSWQNACQMCEEFHSDLVKKLDEFKLKLRRLREKESIYV